MENKIHFHSFDAFRFFAFLKVFIFHVPIVVAANDHGFMQWYADHIKHGGGIGVSFFFVLSGFLITYILTVQKLENDRIDLKNFFFRRAFRIWPLYYLVVIFALNVNPDFAKEMGLYMNWNGYLPDWRFSLTFLENYKTIIMDVGPKTTPLSVIWSLCIEEHFYIVWMLAYFFIKRKYILHFLLSTVVVAIVFRIFEHQIYHTEMVNSNDLFTNLDYFSISGILGYYVAINYQKVAGFVNKIPLIIRYAYIFLVILFLLYQKQILSGNGPVFDLFKYTIISIVFTLLLLIFIPQDSQIKISEKSIFTKLGRISYGLYVYHIIWIHVVLKLFVDNGILLDNWRSYTIFVTCTFSGTVMMSYLSYHFFEMPILKWRDKFFPKKA